MTKARRIDENLSAASIELSAAEIDEVETAVPVQEMQGDRYDLVGGAPLSR